MYLQIKVVTELCKYCILYLWNVGLVMLNFEFTVLFALIPCVDDDGG